MAFQADVRKIDNKIDETSSTNDRTIDGTFDSNKYDVSEMVYPQDLLSNDERYGSNFVVFYINVSDAARPMDVGGNTLGAGDYVKDYDKRVTSSIQESNLSEAQAVAGVLGQNLFAGAGLGAIGSFLRGNFVGSAIGGAASGALATVPVALLAASGIGIQKGRKRLKKAIMMHMPNDVKTQYSMIYGVADLKNFAIGAEGGGKIIDAVKAMGQSIAEDSAAGTPTVDRLKNAFRAGGAAGEGLGTAGAALALSTPNAAGLQALAGVAPNPRTELLFNGVDFRSFAMAYQFFPRNKEEMILIENIIDEFKYHMHPEYLGNNKFIYVNPSEFDISFYHKDEENPHLPKLTSSVLVNMITDYTPQGVWAATNDGAPIQVNLILQFKELATLTKEAIRKGY